MTTKTTTTKPAAAKRAPKATAPEAPAKPARKRVAKDSDLVFVPGVGTVLPDAKPAAKRAANPKPVAEQPAAPKADVLALLPKAARKRAAAAKAAAPAAKSPAEMHAWDGTLSDLTAVQAQIDEKQLAERRDAADPLMVRRNELILRAIEEGAGFAEIARARGVSSSTNRGLIRVLQGGKRL